MVVKRIDNSDSIFFLESPERDIRIEKYFSDKCSKLKKRNEDMNEEIKWRKTRISDYGEHLNMSLDELKDKFKAVTRKRDTIRFTEHLKKKQEKLYKDLESIKEDSKNNTIHGNVLRFRREYENEDSKRKLDEMKNTLDQLKSENKAWKILSEDVQCESDLWNLVTEKRKSSWLTEKKINEYMSNMQKNLSSAVNVSSKLFFAR